jgi:hypothetical protein
MVRTVQRQTKISVVSLDSLTFLFHGLLQPRGLLFRFDPDPERCWRVVFISDEGDCSLCQYNLKTRIDPEVLLE